MNFSKKAFFPLNTIQVNALPTRNTQEELMIYLRTNFKLHPNIYNAKIIENYAKTLENVSILQFHLLDNIFFKPLYECFSLNTLEVRKLMDTKEMQKFIDIILCKIKLFEKLILEDMSQSIQQKVIIPISSPFSRDIRIKIDDYKANLIKKVKQRFFDNILKFLQFFKDTTKKKQELKVSVSHPNYKATLEDEQLSKFIKKHFQKLRNQPTNKEKGSKHRKNEQSAHNLKPLHSHNEFIQKILLCYTNNEDSMKKYLQSFGLTIQEYSEMQTNYRQTKSEFGDYVKFNDTRSIQSQDLYKITKIQRKQELNKSNISLQVLKRQKYINKKFSQNFVMQRPILVRCLNCVQYFYSIFPVNIERNHLVKYQILDSISMIKQKADIIRQVIGGLVNSGGGTILFGCRKSTFGFVPIGQHIKLKQQESYKASFENLLNSITPQKLIDYKIDFIPLKQSPLDSDGKQIINNFSFQIQRPFLHQLYVMRIKISPKNQKQLFCCQIDKKKYFFKRSDDGVSIINLNGQNFYQEMKMKTMKFTEFKNVEQLNRIQQEIGSQTFMKIICGKRQTPQNVHEGKCLQTLTLSVASVSPFQK